MNIKFDFFCPRMPFELTLYCKHT